MPDPCFVSQSMCRTGQRRRQVRRRCLCRRTCKSPKTRKAKLRKIHKELPHNLFGLQLFAMSAKYLRKVELNMTDTDASQLKEPSIISNKVKHFGSQLCLASVAKAQATISMFRTLLQNKALTQSILASLAFMLCTNPAQAQCRMGSGPDQGDGIPWCAPVPETLPSYALPKLTPQPQWQIFAAAVAWGDSKKGSEFTGVGKYFDEMAAREAALDKCRAKGWSNCTIATSILNGVILVAQDTKGNLRTRRDVSEQEARAALAENCRKSGVSCRVLATFDGTAEYF